jgi:hypothetical protein
MQPTTQLKRNRPRGVLPPQRRLAPYDATGSATAAQPGGPRWTETKSFGA